jgi:hypothetical protein
MMTTKPVKDTNPKTRFGKAKPSLSLIPSVALLHTADAFRDGAEKYGPANWRDDPVSMSTYIDACGRHIQAFIDGGEQCASDSGVHHLGHAAACLMIILDAQAQGTIVDDRPTPSKFPEVVQQLTRKIDG